MVPIVNELEKVEPTAYAHKTSVLDTGLVQTSSPAS